MLSYPSSTLQVPLTFSPPIQSAEDLQTNVVSSSINFTYIQQAPHPRKLINVLVLVVTSEAGYHSVYDDACSVNFLRGAGLFMGHVRLDSEDMMLRSFKIPSRLSSQGWSQWRKTF